MTATTTTANSSAPANNEGAVASHEVGMMFVHEYYTFLNKEPSRLHCFYNKQSTMSHGIQGEEPQDIHSKILDLDFEDCKVLVSNVDSQSSLNNGIMIQVLGEMSNRGGPSQKFVQTFFLAEQPRGYYVLNDIFRYLKEDVELEVEAEVEAVEEEPSPEYKIEAEPVAAVTVKDAAPEATAVVVEEIAPVVAATIEVPTPEAVESVPEQKVEVVEEKEAAPAVEEKKPVEKKAEHKKHDRKAEKKDSHKKEAKKETETSKTPEPSKKQPNGAAASAPAPEATLEVIKTPAPAPVVAPAPVPAEPPKPKTWANLAANNSNQWGSHASAAKGSSVNVTPVATPKPQSPVPTQQQSTKPLDRKPNTTNNTREEMLFIYVKNITEKMSLDQLREAFGKFGSVKNIELTHKKNCAYVEFTTVEA
ncbi:hypothetical protein BGZ67_006405, partial [Mortierella alpina]